MVHEVAPDLCETCGRQISTLETCVLPNGTEKRGAEVTFKESAEGGIGCMGCASAGAAVYEERFTWVPGDPAIGDIIRAGGTDMLLMILLRKAGGTAEFDENDVVWARGLMVDWRNGWRPAPELASVRFKSRGWVDLDGAHPDVYELGMREREAGEEGRNATGRT
jgi:hypothetical protein